MAERRMFSKKIIDSDAFLEMPLSTQALYFHLSMRADDEGFIGNPKRIRTMIGASEDDFKLLIAKRFILTFDSGIVVIKHWKIHNYIQNDRASPTTYIEEKSMLALDSKKAYIEIENALDTQCIQNVSKMYTQDRLGKDRLDQDSIESAHTRTCEGYGKYNNVILSDEQYKHLCNQLSNADARIDHLSEYLYQHPERHYADHEAVILKWAEQDKVKKGTGNFNEAEFFDVAVKNAYEGRTK